VPEVREVIKHLEGYAKGITDSRNKEIQKLKTVVEEQQERIKQLRGELDNARLYR